MRKLLASVAMLVYLTQTAGAQVNSPRVPCGKASEIAKHLSETYQEDPVAFGIQSNGNLLQVYSSEKNDTWTLVSTKPDGTSCIVAVGRRWEQRIAPSNDPMA